MQKQLDAANKKSRVPAARAPSRPPGSSQPPRAIEPLFTSDDDGDEDEPLGCDVGDGFGESDGEDDMGAVDPEQCLSEAAKNNRLRRLCEKKPSGRCRVSDDIRAEWEKGGPHRLALRDKLEACDWDKDWGCWCHIWFKCVFSNHYCSMACLDRCTLSHSFSFRTFSRTSSSATSSGRRKSSARPPLSSAGVGTRRTR